MASAIRTLVVCFCAATVTSTAEFVTVETQGTTGYSAQSLKLGCVVKGQPEIEVEISRVFWKKKDHILMKFEKGGLQREDTRLQFADPNWMESKDVSLLVKDTQISDEGTYSCVVVTDRGIAKGDAKLVVKGNYSQPVITSKPEKGEGVELTCVTSGGYPKGAIHWFDATNTNWTRSAETEAIENEDKSFTLKSRFISKDTLHAPYTCVVFNSEWEEEGMGESNLTLNDTYGSPDHRLNDQTKNIAAGVVVIGSLICGLLIALLIFRRRSRRANRRPSTQPMLNSDPDDQDIEAQTELQQKV